MQLHKSGPLGDSILECYNSGSRNVFALGFVPVKGENTVVLLGRDTQPNAPGIRDLNLDLSTWQPLIGEDWGWCKASGPPSWAMRKVWLLVIRQPGIVGRLAADS